MVCQGVVDTWCGVCGSGGYNVLTSRMNDSRVFSRFFRKHGGQL